MTLNKMFYVLTNYKLLINKLFCVCVWGGGLGFLCGFLVVLLHTQGQDLFLH